MGYNGAESNEFGIFTGTKTDQKDREEVFREYIL